MIDENTIVRIRKSVDNPYEPPRRQQDIREICDTLSAALKVVRAALDWKESLNACFERDMKKKLIDSLALFEEGEKKP